MRGTNRVWRLRKRPVGVIGDDVLSLEKEQVPEPGEGQFVFRLNYLSLDPTNRIWMSDMDQYMPPVAVGEVMRGVVCGTVVKSKNAGFTVGDIVSGLGSWAEYQVGTPATLGKMGPLGGVPVADAFGLFAAIGPTAYFGLIDIGAPKAGETVVVSAAAGAVGSVVGQIARIMGCRAVGLAGSDEKCKWIVNELGFDASINYKTENVAEALKRTCPKGIDVYFDNVGGDHLDAAFAVARNFARFAICGMIDRYNDAEGGVEFKYLIRTIPARIRMQGFIFTDYAEHMMEFLGEMGPWVMNGDMKMRETVHQGIGSAFDAFLGLFSGGNTGKMLVKL